MPSIIGFTSNQSIVATTTTIVVPSPTCGLNDLLVAVIVADTGTATWTSPGWTSLSARTNTSQLAIMYKISSASEASEYTFSSSTQESFNVRVISIKEVNTVNPFGNPSCFVMDTQAAAVKYQLSTINTTVANSLILYGVSNAVAGVPSIIEGPVTLLCAEDGLAESGGVGWTFKSSVGTTPSNITCSNIVTGAGVKLSLQIAPPTSGATQIPAFCASDSSVYIDPIHGVTAYNTNSALAATFDTLFSTTISGVTAADAAVAAIADVGINSFHSAGRVTSIADSKNWAGVALDLAVGNNIDVTGKNILVHTGPSTPGQIQRIGPVSSGKGILFGMRSTAGNWKVWHVHGQGTPFGYQRDVPLIINSSNTTGLLHTSGSTNFAAIDVFGFAVAGGGVSTTIWDFYSLWMLDTTIICGGSSTTPITIPGIVSAAAYGHERKSVVQQGASQAIIYQPICFGSGGTENMYLDLNATAIEFPKQYSRSSLEVNYCSANGIAGITYWAGPTDTIKHRNSVVSSPSQYHWGFHTSSNTAATYDFSGLQVIGAKPINTRSGITISSAIFNRCGTFDLNGMILNDCTFSSSIDTASMKVDTVSEFNNVVDCVFSNNNRAIEFTVAGTYTMSGNTFNGNTVDICNSSSGSVIINAVNGANPTTSLNISGGSVTINNTKILTLTNIINDSEVRVYSAGTTNELAGQESVTSGSFIYSYNYSANTYIDIVIFKENYNFNEPTGRLSSILLSNGDSSIPVNQQVDRNYLNP